MKFRKNLPTILATMLLITFIGVDANSAHLLTFIDGIAHAETDSVFYTQGCCPRENYTIMRPDVEKLQIWVEQYESSPEAYIDPDLEAEIEAHRGTYSLLPHLDYVPVERDQGYCGNCWAWAGTGVMEIALDVQEGVYDRLSIQYLTSCYHGGTGPQYACCGGWLADLATFYSSTDQAVPWSNTNAHWQDGGQSCGGSTTVSCGSISTTPSYLISSCTAESISTHGVGQATAIANIKNVLHQGKAVWFGFFMATGSDWTIFRDFWRYDTETTVWNPDYSCGHTWDAGGGGHAVLCVGYNDDDPENSYWIMVNSWGTASGIRPNGIFRVDMDMSYDCYFFDPYPIAYYSFYWQTLDVNYEDGPEISIYTQNYTYSAGDPMYLGLDIINPGPELTCCVAVWLEKPGGGVKLITHAHSITLPSGMDYCNPAFKYFTLPSITSGTYTWHAALLDPTSHDIIIENTSEWVFV